MPAIFIVTLMLDPIVTYYCIFLFTLYCAVGLFLLWGTLHAARERARGNNKRYNTILVVSYLVVGAILFLLLLIV